MPNCKVQLTKENISNLVKTSIAKKIDTSDLLNSILMDYFHRQNVKKSFFERSFNDDIAVIDGFFADMGIN